MSAQVAIVPFAPTYRAFILDSFLRSFGRSAYGEGVPARVLIDLLEPLLVGWDVSVAVSMEDHNEALGWVCARKPDAVAWLFVKPPYRRMGLAKALLDHAGVGKLLSAPFVPTKLFDRPFMAVAQERGYRVRFRPYLPLSAEHALQEAAETR